MLDGATETAIEAAIDRRWDEQVAFLAELVRTPSDNPPGDLAPIAAVAAAGLERLGFEVSRHPVPADVLRAHGLDSLVNVVGRRRYGDGPVIALNALVVVTRSASRTSARSSRVSPRTANRERSSGLGT